MPESNMPESKSQNVRTPRRTYRISLDDGMGGEEIIRARSDRAAIARAMEWCDEGDWSSAEGVAYAHVGVYRRTRDGEETVGLQHRQVGPASEEPDCLRGADHDWQSPMEVVGGIKENPGVWGDGGGVRCLSICIRCGLRQRSGNWGQCRECGEQGLDWQAYEEPDEASLAYVAETVREEKGRLLDLAHDEGRVCDVCYEDDDVNDDGVWGEADLCVHHIRVD